MIRARYRGISEFGIKNEHLSNRWKLLLDKVERALDVQIPIYIIGMDERRLPPAQTLSVDIQHGSILFRLVFITLS